MRYDDIADAVKEEAQEARERALRQRQHIDDLAEFDAKLGLPPWAYLTRAEHQSLQAKAPRFYGAMYVGRWEYRWIDNATGEPVRFFDDRITTGGKVTQTFTSKQRDRRVDESARILQDTGAEMNRQVPSAKRLDVLIDRVQVALDLMRELREVVR